MAGMISVAELREYLGVDSFSDGIISRCLNSALAGLKVSTGIDFDTEPEGERLDLASEAVQIKVWISFFADRGDAAHAAFLRQRLTEIGLQLKYGGGGTDGDEQQGGTSSTS